MERYLQYQEIDKKLIAIENDMKSSDCFKEYAKANNVIKVATERLAKVEAEAGDLISSLSKLTATLSAVTEELGELVTAVEDVDDIKEIDYYVSSIEKLSEKADGLEKEINRVKKEIDEKIKTYNDLMAKGKEATKAKKEFGEKVKTLKAEKQGEVDAIRTQLAEIEKQLDPTVMEKYKALRASKKPPYFVPLSGENCTGCGMELAYATLSKLKNVGDHVECPHCQKILYK